MAEKKDNIFKKTGKFFKNAFHDMAEDAKAQAKVDKANLAAVKAESKATFEENRFTNSYARAKEIGKQSWDDAHMTPAQRREKVKAEQEAQIKEAEARKAEAEARYEAAKVPSKNDNK